jgi:hypothetical protein
MFKLCIKFNNYTIILQTETALMYDAVHLFARALHVLDASQQIEVKSLSCDLTDTWDHGYSLINYMKNVRIINSQEAILLLFCIRSYNFVVKKRLTIASK